MSNATHDSKLESAAVSPEQSLAEMARDEQGQFLIREFWQFVKENGKWWLVPVVAVLLCIGLLFVASQTGLAPYLYALW